jgi:RNA polymerase sigma factor (sigma-70 family)
VTGQTYHTNHHSVIAGIYGLIAFRKFFGGIPTILPAYASISMLNHLQLDQTEQLVQGSIKGDRSAQFRLYNLFAPKMMGVCMRYAHSKIEAGELLQEGFIKVFDKLNQFRNEGSLEGWIRRIMVTTALQRFRAQQSIPAFTGTEELETHAGTDADVNSLLDTKELMGMVQQLPPACRLVFNLYVFEGMKHREIAEALGISQGTSKSNLSDARCMLQKAIQKNNPEIKTKMAAYG